MGARELLRPSNRPDADVAPVDELPYRGDDAPIASRLDGLRWCPGGLLAAGGPGKAFSLYLYLLFN